MKLDDQIRKVVNESCERTGVEVEKLAWRIGYKNREFIDSYFNHGKGTMRAKTLGKILGECKKIDPTLKEVTFEFDKD
jgi:hypothetical protein